MSLMAKKEMEGARYPSRKEKCLNNKSLKPLTGLQKGNLKPNHLLCMTKTKTKKINNELSGSNQWRLT